MIFGDAWRKYGPELAGQLNALNQQTGISAAQAAEPGTMPLLRDLMNDYHATTARIGRPLPTIPQAAQETIGDAARDLKLFGDVGWALLAPSGLGGPPPDRTVYLRKSPR